MLWLIADAHLSEQMYVHRPLIRGDSYRALDSIVDKILDKHEEGSVIFCGDNFNSARPSALDVHVMMESVYRLEQKGIAVYGIQGNHDLSKKSWMDLCEVNNLHKQTIEIEGKKVYGLDYTPGARIFEELDHINREIECDILVLHQSFVHLCPFDSYSLEVDDIPGSVREAVVSGHIHIPDKRENSLGISVVSPGATHPRSISQPSGTFIQYNDKDFLHIATPSSRLIKRFFVFDKPSMEETVEELEKLEYMTKKGFDEWPLIEIKYHVDCISYLEKLNKYIDRCHLFTKAHAESLMDPAEEIQIDMNTSKKDILEQCIDKDSPEFKLTMTLLESNPTLVIEELDAEFRSVIKEIKDEAKETETA